MSPRVKDVVVDILVVTSAQKTIFEVGGVYHANIYMMKGGIDSSTTPLIHFCD